jgi:hypothetical protein
MEYQYEKTVSSCGTLSCFANFANADKMPSGKSGPELKIFGFSEAQYAFIDQDNDTNYSNGGKLRDHGLSIKNRIKFAVDNETSKGFKYGAYLSLRGDTNADEIAVQTYVYAEDKYGKILLGSHESASESMQMTAADIDLALGGYR